MEISAIAAVAERIAREFHPERIVLFGSHAYGTPHEHSDVDMLVVMPVEGNGLMQSAAILRRVQPPFAFDLIVHTAAQLEQGLAWGDRFLREILSRGKVLYVAPRG